MCIDERKIIRIVLEHYPMVQAIYVYGSFAEESAAIRPESDIDLALLLPFTEQHQLMFTQLHDELIRQTGREVDLVNLRHADTILQKEVIAAEKCIYCKDRNKVIEFEMLVLSFYQELNQQRAAIVEQGLKDGRFYQP